MCRKQAVSQRLCYGKSWRNRLNKIVTKKMVTSLFLYHHSNTMRVGVPKYSAFGLTLLPMYSVVKPPLTSTGVKLAQCWVLLKPHPWRGKGLLVQLYCQTLLVEGLYQHNSSFAGIVYTSCPNEINYTGKRMSMKYNYVCTRAFASTEMSQKSHTSMILLYGQNV